MPDFNKLKPKTCMKQSVITIPDQF